MPVTLIAIGLFALESVVVLVASPELLVSRFNADDFYYYLVLARNAADGLGPTFDGVAQTNGFHPLYFALTTLLAAALNGHPLALVRTAMLLLLAAHATTGLLLFRGFTRLGRADVGELVALAWLVNPGALSIALQGVETALAMPFWCLVILMVYERHSGLREDTTGFWVQLGGILGLAILTRTDALVLLLAIVTLEVSRFREGVLTVARRTAILSASAFVITLPWWLFSMTTFGTISQDSAAAIYFGTHGPRPRPLLEFDSDLLTALANYLRAAVFVSAVPLLVIFLARDADADRRRGAWLVLGATRVGAGWLTVGLLAGFYILRQWYVQEWYLLSLALVVTITAGMIWSTIPVRRVAALRKGVALMIATTSIVVFLVTWTGGLFGYDTQRGALTLAAWVREHTPRDAAVATMNSGIVGYFSERRIINLDGVVNHRLRLFREGVSAWGVNDLVRFLHQERVSYVGDYDQPPLPEHPALRPIAVGDSFWISEVTGGEPTR